LLAGELIGVGDLGLLIPLLIGRGLLAVLIEPGLLLPILSFKLRLLLPVRLF
jgi:hypothetical protein